MHVCIDEDTHPLRLAAHLSVYSSRNVHRRSRLKPPGPKTRLVSQEPRRPRFSFFHLHNVKELTSDPLKGRRRWKQCFRILANRTLSPVARHQACPFRNVDQWERLALGVVNVAGCMRDTSACQHPCFKFWHINRRGRQKAGKTPGRRACPYVGTAKEWRNADAADW